MTMNKVRHDKDFRLELDGTFWTIDVAEWRDPANASGELRVYRIGGDITNPKLRDALELEASTRGLALLLNKTGA